MNRRGVVLTHRTMWMVLISSLFAGAALAGTTGTEFKPIFDLLTGWIGGYLGRTIALAAFIIGVGYGAFKQNGLIALGGILFAIFILIIPGVLNSMLAATI